MAFSGLLPIDMLIRDLDLEPKQLDFSNDVFYPCFTIREEYLTSINTDFSWVNADGTNASIISSSVDHPAFTALRNKLESMGLIRIERGWWNGDVVTKPFALNNCFFKRGEKFPCAVVMGGCLNTKKRLYSDS